MPLNVSRRAERDLDRMPKRDRDRVLDALDELDLSAWDKLDIKALKGHSPWLRLRVGNYRVLYRDSQPDDKSPGWQIARVINRRDLDAVVKQL